MSIINDIAEFGFIQNAFLATVFMSIVCAVIGTYVVVRRLVFLSGGVTHASFGGVGIAYYLGVNPLWGALLFSVATVVGFEFMSRGGRVREDSAIGVFWALGMAVGILFVFMTPGYAPNLMSFLFGNILTVSSEMLWLNGILAFIVLTGFLLFNRPLMYIAFDRDFSAVQKIRTSAVNSVMLIVIAVSIVFMLKLVGIMLLVSLLTIPPMIVSSFCGGYKQITLWSIAVSFVGAVTGLAFSVLWDVPASAAIIVIYAVMYVLSRAIVLISK